MEQKGGIPYGCRAFCLPVTQPIGLWWQSHHFNPETIGVTRHHDELAIISPKQFTVFAFCPTVELIERAGELIEISQPNHMLDERPLASVTPLGRARLTGMCGEIFRLNHNRRLTESEFEEMFLGICMELLTVFGREGRPRPRPNGRLRDRALKRALALIHDDPKARLTIPYLSRQVGVSARTLGYAFQEACGLSPKAFIQVQKLNRAHRALLSASHGHAQVCDIARAAGFSHLGQFAHDYKRQFDQSPSTTLQNQIQVQDDPKSEEVIDPFWETATPIAPPF